MRIRDTVTGVGPILVGVTGLLTFASLGAHHYQLSPHLPSADFYATHPLTRWIPRLMALVLAGGGIYQWAATVIWGRFLARFKSGELMTAGTYARVRHPIYSSFLMVCVAILLWPGNLWLVAVMVANWALMTIVLARTEEQWCHERFGDAYHQYCQRTPRLIPRCR